MMRGLFAAVGFVAWASLQAGQGAPPVVLKAGAGVILGKVTETGTTTGVPNAVVNLYGVALGSPAAVFSNGLPGGPRRVIADGQGQFLFRDLPSGAYTITSTAVG